jgi:RNA polymerase sigma factor (sigma-70 family)
MDDASRVQLQNALKTLSVNRTDEDAWRVLYEKTRTTALEAAKRILRDQAELADDVVQEAFLRIFRYCKFADFPDACAFLRYLRTVCGNASRDMLEGLTAESVVESPESGELEKTQVSEDTPEDLVIAQETLNEFMNQLDESDREMLHLSMEVYDLAEIADRRGLPYSNAGVRPHRSRERLRNHLKTRGKIPALVCKKPANKEVLYGQEGSVKREPAPPVPIRARQGPIESLIRRIQKSEPEPLPAQSFSHSH